MQPVTRSPAIRERHGFTVIELLLAVAIMTVIVIGLYTVFDHTQKALRGSMAQTDVLEGVRAATDLVGRELESAAYLPLANYTNFYVSRATNSQTVQLNGLMGAPLFDTVLQDVFFHTRLGDHWSAVGYWVGPAQLTNQTGKISVGRLYRF